MYAAPDPSRESAALREVEKQAGAVADECAVARAGGNGLRCVAARPDGSPYVWPMRRRDAPPRAARAGADPQPQPLPVLHIKVLIGICIRVGRLPLRLHAPLGPWKKSESE